MRAGLHDGATSRHDVGCPCSPPVCYNFRVPNNESAGPCVPGPAADARSKAPQRGDSGLALPRPRAQPLEIRHCPFCGEKLALAESEIAMFAPTHYDNSQWSVRES